jgi:hypothetical protein
MAYVRDQTANDGEPTALLRAITPIDIPFGWIDRNSSRSIPSGTESTEISLCSLDAAADDNDDESSSESSTNHNRHLFLKLENERLVSELWQLKSELDMFRRHSKFAAAGEKRVNGQFAPLPQHEEKDLEEASQKGHTMDGASLDNSDLEPSFCATVWDRAGWLVGLLVMQSLSSFIIARNEVFLRKHLVFIQFLTMLVGAGGNAGNQSSVRGKDALAQHTRESAVPISRTRYNVYILFCSHISPPFFVSVIRALALESIHERNVMDFLTHELKMGATLSAISGLAGGLRAAIFQVPLIETIALTVCLCSIVWISVVLGALLPLAMKHVRIDPANSSTTIQVIMDIVGVAISVHMGGAILNSDYAAWLEGKQ